MLKNQENSQNQNPLLKNTKDQEEMQKRIQILLQKKQYQEKKQKEEELENERKENQEEESEFERLRKIEKRKKIDAIVQQRMREKNKEMENKKNEQESNYDLQEVTESLDIQRVWSQDSFRSNISKPKNTIQNEKIQQILARKIQKEEKNTEKTPNKTIAINPVNSDPILSIMKKKHKQQAIKENILPNSVSKLQNRAQSTNFFSDESPFIDKQDSLLLRQGLQILYRGMNSESLVVYKSTQITREMMRSFYEKESFPEEMVRLYINSLNKRFFQSSNLFIFDIDFYPKLISEGLKSDFVLQQFSILEDKLFKLDQAIIPIKEISVNNQSYTLPNKTEINWSLAVVNFNRRVIVHFDLFPESDKLRILHDLMNVLQFFANIFDSQIFRSHGEWTWLTRMDLEKNYKYLLPSKKSTINNLSGIFMLNFLQMVLKPDFIKKNGKIDIGILKELKLKDDATFRLSIINDLISFYKNQALK
ncbi:ensconsin isoform f [Anaeramoeba ignava]|uniref:Ensconsin isoform f n=1 Tax=Anaeramoeba ignava TaxID=1746090 RepID=A0A9Q0LH88_ANAIG|nr:ensconsin isoform f [Anaeramoeba ignava]